jgi:hypothetical protein
LLHLSCLKCTPGFKHLPWHWIGWLEMTGPAGPHLSKDFEAASIASYTSSLFSKSPGLLGNTCTCTWGTLCPACCPSCRNQQPLQPAQAQEDCQ